MSLQQPDYQISVMSQDELQTAIDWAGAEGWNPGLDDAVAFYAADNQGFLLGKINDQAVATISAVKYGNSFGFIGLYIVAEPFRHQGYGLHIWNKALEHLRGRSIGLDGVLAQQDNYRKSGFRLAHRNIRFAGISNHLKPVAANIVELASLGVEVLLAYDAGFFPAKRADFLKAWINQPHSHAMGIIENGKLVGYGVIRACRTGYKIGPLNAENKDLAIDLFNALLAQIPLGSAIYLDVPEPNAQAIDIARMNAMSPAFETARMYTGDFPDMALDKIFGITSFELG
ncbi:MAG: GNAT family N-acetyltransferase [Gammaproteobacteria bacterium 28-57-27]|nr:MAG: GNAT family N-acetyltransferase [Gammaproteobacteria bacterium 28-57-27]